MQKIAKNEHIHIMWGCKNEQIKFYFFIYKLNLT